MTIPVVVSGPEGLAEFRRALTGERLLEQLEEAAGRLLITLPVGVGKSEAMVKVIAHALTELREFDLVVVLLPRRDILDEIRRRLPPGIDPVVLEPRPRRRCGERDAFWLELESAGCGLLAKEELCGSCPRREGCTWPGQFGRDRLKGVGLILATQQHLVINPMFVQHLRLRTGAGRVLVLLDESDLLVKSTRRTIRRGDLLGFIDAQEAVIGANEQRDACQEEWVGLSRLIAQAHDADLSEGRWRFPQLDGGWAVDVMRAGRALAGSPLPFLGFELGNFARSDPASRGRNATGDVEFSCPTDLGDRFMVFSGSIARGLARYRLDPDHRRPGLASPYEHVRFEHPGSRWFNLGSIAGAEKYFPKNAPAILDFFAAKVAANIRAGKRTLLVAKKKFVPLCAAELARRLDEMGVGPVRIVTGGWDDVDLTDPRVLPLINYGISGVNRFEGHDTVYCLSGYYASAAAVTAVVNDLSLSAERIPVRIVISGSPPRRRAIVEQDDDVESILPQVARWVLQQKEDDVVVQAVGRVRPFTKPREVITFQVGGLFEVEYKLQFGSLAEARAHFDIPTNRRRVADAKAAEARRLKANGLKNQEILAKVRVSDSTLKRYLRGGHEPFININTDS